MARFFQKLIIGVLFLPLIHPINDAMSTQPSKQLKHSASLMNEWHLISDQVMGGKSFGQITRDEDHLYQCLHLKGNVTTENNGGFLQIAHDLTASERANAEQATGIRLLVRGNNESYNIHLRTSDLTLPWQSYRASFEAVSNWQQISLPFKDFEAYKTSAPLALKKLHRIGLVAIGRNFEADICMADMQFY